MYWQIVNIINEQKHSLHVQSEGEFYLDRDKYFIFFKGMVKVSFYNNTVLT